MFSIGCIKSRFVVRATSSKWPNAGTKLVWALTLLSAAPVAGQLPSSAVTFARADRRSPQASQLERLYVLDSRQYYERGQIIVLSFDMHVMKTISTGFRPDFTLSPDGSRLFVMSQETPSGADILAVIDPVTGEVLDTRVVPDRMRYIVKPEHSTMVVSPDGRWLFIGKHTWTPADERNASPQRDHFAFAIYDIQGLSLAKADIPVSDNCLGMQLLPSAVALHVVCSSENRLYSYPLSSSGLGSPRVVFLPSNPQQVFVESPTTPATTTVHPHIAGGVASPDGKTLTLVTSYLRVIQIDANTGQIGRVEQVRNDRWALITGILTSPDGSRIYVPVGPLSRVNMALGVDEILVLDARTLAQTATIHTAGQFWSMSMSKDGRYFYATDPNTQNVYVVDAFTGLGIQKMPNIGASPSRVATGPI